MCDSKAENLMYAPNDGTNTAVPLSKAVKEQLLWDIPAKNIF